MCLTGSGTILFKRNGFKFLKQVESKKSQFEIVFKSLARFSTQFRVMFTCCISKENLVINHATLWQKTTLNFSRPCRRVRPAKLNNHRAHTNLEIQ